MKEIVFVLSMHRSGSSLLTKGLECCSVSLGNDLMGPADDNPKGFFEDKGVYEINEYILATLDYQWSIIGSSPKETTPEMENAFGKRIEEHLLASTQANVHSDHLGIKDPRLCRTGPLWFRKCEQLSIPYKIIFLYRNPASVAASLARRNNMGEKGGAALWCDYNLKAMQISLNTETLIVQLEAFTADMERHLADIAIFLGTGNPLPSTKQFAEDFFDPKLLHSPRKRNPVAGKLHERLQTLGSGRIITDKEKHAFIELSQKEQSKPQFLGATVEQLNWHRKAENDALRALIDRQADELHRLRDQISDLNQDNTEFEC